MESKFKVECDGINGYKECIYRVYEDGDYVVEVYHKDKAKCKELAETFARIYEHGESFDKRSFAEEVLEKFKSWYYENDIEETGTMSSGTLKIDNFLNEYYPLPTRTYTIDGKEMTKEEVINYLNKE